MKKKNNSSVKTKSVGNRGLLPYAKIPDPNNYTPYSPMADTREKTGA